MWWLSALGGLGVLLTGLLAPADALSVIERIATVLIFLVAVTVIAGLADAARSSRSRPGKRLTRPGPDVAPLVARGRPGHRAYDRALLDTCAVLLTPVVLAMARQLDIPPKLFAFTTVWLAGTASLLLPVSNLTNLLALHRFDQLGLGLQDYVGLSWRPAIVRW